MFPRSVEIGDFNDARGSCGYNFLAVEEAELPPIKGNRVSLQLRKLYYSFLGHEGIKDSFDLFARGKKGPGPGFEPGPEDPQSHMLPSYTTSAILCVWFLFVGNGIITYVDYKNVGYIDSLRH